MQILLYIARANYDSHDLQQAKQCLLRAIHLAPTDHKLWFNAALTMQVCTCP
jgi:RNA polymerase-associated protein CTR9